MPSYLSHSFAIFSSIVVFCVLLFVDPSWGAANFGDVDIQDNLGGSTMPSLPGVGGQSPQSEEDGRVSCANLYVEIPGVPRPDVDPCYQAEPEPQVESAASCMPKSWREIRGSSASISMDSCVSRTRNNCPSWNTAWIQDGCVALVREFCAHSAFGGTPNPPGCDQSPFAIAAVPPLLETMEPGGRDEYEDEMRLPEEGPIPMERPKRTPTADDEVADSDGKKDQAGTDTMEDSNDPNNPNASGGTPSQYTQQNANQLAQICLNTFAEANQCCNSPLSCMGVDQSSQNDLAALAGVGGTAASGQSIQQACEMMRVAGYSSTGINGAGAYMCSESKNSCLDTCEASKAEIVRMIQVECGYNPDQTTGSCSGVQSAYDLVTSRQRSCMTFSANVAAMGKQAAHSHSSTQMAALCAEQSRTELSGTGYERPVQNLTAIDCADPLNQYDARCRDCSNPTMANSALCKTGRGGTDYQQGVSQAGKTNAPNDMSSKSDFGSRSSGGAGYGMDGVGENSQQQQAQFGVGLGQQQAAASKGIPNNGGSFAGGGSGAAGFGGGGRQASAGGARGGYNTDVLGGFRGGSGYSNPAGPNKRAVGQRPGFRGPAQANTNQRQGIKFDLKKFLPGGSKDPNHRLAGVAGTASSEIGPSHVDIWSRMSNRVREICKLNRLYDCGRKK